MEIYKFCVLFLQLKAYLHISPILHSVSWFTNKTKYFCFQKYTSLKQNQPLKSDV